MCQLWWHVVVRSYCFPRLWPRGFLGQCYCDKLRHGCGPGRPGHRTDFAQVMFLTNQFQIFMGFHGYRTSLWPMFFEAFCTKMWEHERYESFGFVSRGSARVSSCEVPTNVNNNSSIDGSLCGLILDVFGHMQKHKSMVTKVDDFHIDQVSLNTRWQLEMSGDKDRDVGRFHCWCLFTVSADVHFQNMGKW